MVGAQAQGFNDQTTGIANIGDYSSVQQSSVALDAMARLIRWKLPIQGVPTAGRGTLTSNGDGSDHGWGGHYLVMGTPVVGQRFYGTMPSLEIDGPDDTRGGRPIRPGR